MEVQSRGLAERDLALLGQAAVTTPYEFALALLPVARGESASAMQRDHAVRVAGR